MRVFLQPSTAGGGLNTKHTAVAIGCGVAATIFVAVVFFPSLICSALGIYLGVKVCFVYSRTSIDNGLQMVWNTTDQYVWYLVLCDCLCDSFSSIVAAVVHYSMVQKKRKT